MDQKTKIEAEPGRQDLIITREFDLPVELLFRAHTEADLIEQWMGTKVIEWNCINHGGYHYQTSHLNQVVFEASGAFHKLIKNAFIVRTFEMHQSPIGVQMEVMTFEEREEGSSQLTTHIIYQSESHRAEQLKLPFAFGLNMAHNRLQEKLNQYK